MERSANSPLSTTTCETKTNTRGEHAAPLAKVACGMGPWDNAAAGQWPSQRVALRQGRMAAPTCCGIVPASNKTPISSCTQSSLKDRHARGARMNHDLRRERGRVGRSQRRAADARSACGCAHTQGSIVPSIVPRGTTAGAVRPARRLKSTKSENCSYLVLARVLARRANTDPVLAGQLILELILELSQPGAEY